MIFNRNKFIYNIFKKNNVKYIKVYRSYTSNFKIQGVLNDTVHVKVVYEGGGLYSLYVKDEQFGWVEVYVFDRSSKLLFERALVSLVKPT